MVNFDAFVQTPTESHPLNLPLYLPKPLIKQINGINTIIPPPTAPKATLQ
jgi:hypothetical protein